MKGNKFCLSVKPPQNFFALKRSGPISYERSVGAELPACKVFAESCFHRITMNVNYQAQQVIALSDWFAFELVFKQTASSLVALIKAFCIADEEIPKSFLQGS